MEKFVQVAKKEGNSYEDIPLNDDGSLSLSILHKYFPRANGLKYYSDTDVSHNIDLNDDRFYPPLGLWGDMIYYCIFSSDDSVSPKSESLCIEDIPLSTDEYDSTNDLNAANNKINKSNGPKTKKRAVRPKGKYKKRKPYKCDICDKNFRNKDYMERHKIVHTGEKPFSCSLCEEKFFRQDLLRIHSNKVHNISRASKLVLTPRSSTAPKRDKPKNDDLYVYAAVKKRKYTRRKDKGEGFFNEEDKKPKKHYECCTCSVQFSKKSELKRHSCNSTPTQFTCEECRQTFTKLNKLRLHLFKCHADRTPKKTILVKPEPVQLAPRTKGKCKYASRTPKPEPSEVDSSEDEIAFWDCGSDSESTSYISKCDCVPGFNIVKYIEDKIPAEILAKFKYCKENNIPWTGFLGYSALYKFWIRIVTDNPVDSLYREIVHVDPEEDVYQETVTDYLIAEEGDEEQPSEATTENSNFLKGLDDLIKFN